MIFFRWDLKTPCVKNNKCKLQAKKKISIVISTTSHFWSPTLTSLWWSVFVSLISMVYSPPYPQIFFLWEGLNFFLYLVARGWEYFKFLGDLLYWGALISFLGEGGIFFHKAINDQSCKLKNS